MSSDLSIELSHHEEQIPSLSFQDDEKSDEEEEEELPSFLTQMGKSERNCSGWMKITPENQIVSFKHCVFKLIIFFNDYYFVFQSLRPSRMERLCGANLEIILSGLHG